MIDRIVARFPQVNRQYLEDGTLPILKGSDYVPQLAEVQPDATEALGQVPLLPISAIAGQLSGFDVGVQLSECERIASPISGVDFVIEVTGESMSPDYPSGSRVFVKRIDMEAFIEWGRVYLLDTINGSVLKVVQPSDTDERVRCVSCNPAFAPFDVRMRDIRAMYRVLLCMTLK
jgi:phage repressor protein C with HTH and peptisase S24 domain